MTSANKRFKLFRARSDEDEMAGGNSTPLLVRFYDPEVKARDPNGRTLDDILGWSDARLESCHDYIQTIFPLPEGSMFNYGAIIITREVLEAFRARADLRIRLRASFLRMLRFYGFELQEESEQTVNSVVETPTNSAETITKSEEKPKGSDEASETTETTSKEIDAPSDETETPSKDTNIAQETTVKTDAKEESVLREEPSTSGQESTDHNKKAGNSASPNKTIATARNDVDTSAPDQSDAAVATLNDSKEEETTAPEASQKQATETGEHFTPATASATKNPQTQAKVKSLIPAARIVRGPNWAQNSRNWVVPIDHNHLRITRILRSLRVLGLQDECEAFFEALHEVVNDPNSRLGKRSMGYWRRALELPLHVAPDGTEVAWLGKWVREQEKTIGTK